MKNIIALIALGLLALGGYFLSDEYNDPPSAQKIQWARSK
jgi:hypothetical protein